MKTQPMRTYYTEIPYAIISSGKALPKPVLRQVSWNNTRSDAVNPHWRSQVVNKREAGTSHTCTFQEHTVNPYGGSYVAKGSGKTGIFRYAPPTQGLHAPIAQALRDRTDAECIGRFRSKVQSAVLELSGPTFLGELRSTVRMIRSPASTLYRSFSRYVRAGNRLRRRAVAKPGSRAKYERQLNRLYLSYTYGWAPLMSDVEGAVKALSDFHRLKSDFITASKTSESPVLTTRTSSPLDQHLVTTTATFKAIYSVQCYGKIRAELIGSPGSYERMKNTLGFSMREFIPTLWNLLPFSFVVDYFTNVNELLLSDYSTSATLVYSGMTRLNYSETTTDVAISRAGSAATTAWTGYPGSRFEKAGDFSRSIGIGALTPTVSLPSPKQLINTTSLILALTEGRR